MALFLVAGEAVAQSSASFPDAEDARPPASAAPSRPASQPTPAAPTYSPTGGYTKPQSPGPPPRPWPYSFAPAVLPYREGQEVPAGYRLEDTANHGLVAAGAVTFSAAYAAGIVGAATAGFGKGTTWLFAPIVGPFGAIASRENPCPTETFMGRKVVREECIDNALDEVLAIVLIAMDGMVQITGATLLIVGASNRQKQLVRLDVASLGIRPSIDRKAAGLQLHGMF